MNLLKLSLFFIPLFINGASSESYSNSPQNKKMSSEDAKVYVRLLIKYDKWEELQAHVKEITSIPAEYIVYAIHHGSFDIFKFLMEYSNTSATLKYNNQPLLYEAAISGDLEKVKYLLAHGAQISDTVNVSTKTLIRSESRCRGRGYSSYIVNFFQREEWEVPLCELQEIANKQPDIYDYLKYIKVRNNISCNKTLVRSYTEDDAPFDYD